MRLNVQQLLFEAFPHIMHIFGSVKPESESTFHFSTIGIIFDTYQFLEFHSFTTRGGAGVVVVVADRHARPLNFYRQFSAQQFLFKEFFYVMHIFSIIEP